MNALVELMSAKARKYTYAVLSAAVAVYGIWEASQGEWQTFAVGIVTALVGLMATANTHVVKQPKEDVEFDNDDSPQFIAEER